MGALCCRTGEGTKANTQSLAHKQSRKSSKSARTSELGGPQSPLRSRSTAYASSTKTLDAFGRSTMGKSDPNDIFDAANDSCGATHHSKEIFPEVNLPGVKLIAFLETKYM